MKRFDSLGTAYLTGDFNCWGEGSIVLSGMEPLSSEIELPPSRYGYSILVNQYHKYLENGGPTKKRSHLDLKLEKAYHNPHLSQFSCLSDGLMELRTAVPRETKKVELLCKGKVIFKNRTRVENYDVHFSWLKVQASILSWWTTRVASLWIILSKEFDQERL